MIRLTALWALSEAGLGGLLHLLRTPFTGLLVGSVAVVLISLMAYVSDKPYKSIPKALILVLIVKMTISPHSPLPAYLAVSFQGILGAILFSIIPSFRVSCMLLGLISLMESALQKLITLTIIFGNSIWDSLDLFVDFIMKKLSWIDQTQSVNGSLWIVLYYVSLYAVFGLIVGYFASLIPTKVDETLPQIHKYDFKLNPLYKVQGKTEKPQWWKSNKLRGLVLIVLIIVALFLLVPEARVVLNPIWIFFRVLLVLAAWYFIVAPILIRLFKSFLDKKTSQYRQEVNTALALIPVFRQLVFTVWDSLAGLKGLKRVKSFAIRMIALALVYNEADHE